MKRMALRRGDVCSVCATSVEVGEQAWWDATRKVVVCLRCEAQLAAASVDGAESDGQADTEPGVRKQEIRPLSAEERGFAGASARQERERRSARREERVRAKHPKVGGFILSISDDPRSTTVWDQGAAGEERVAATLDGAQHLGLVALHDRRLVPTKANIDHLVIAPNGVWVVDAKRYPKGRLERRDVGRWLKSDTRLFIGGRDKSALLVGVQKQVDRVSAALASSEFEGIPVHGALCFVDTELKFFAKPFTMNGISVTWRKHLVLPMLSPVVLDEPARHRLARVLADTFPIA